MRVRISSKDESVLKLMKPALAWLEYCNSSQDTYYANLRRANGHEEPYNASGNSYHTSAFPHL